MSRTTDSLRSIVVPVDGSPLAEQAIPAAVDLAQRAGSKLRLVLVHRELSPLLIMEPAEVYTKTLLAFQKFESDYLRTLTDRVEKKLGRAVSSAALKGPAATTLAEYIQDIGADLVVMTTHGHGGIRRAWLGSVTDYLIRTVKVPVLVVRAREGTGAARAKKTIPDILVPLDGSPLAESVLEPVAVLARLWDAKVSLLQVVHPALLATDPALPLPTGYNEELTAMEREAAEDYLRDIRETLEKRGVKSSSIVVLGGTTADAILEFSGSDRTGLVALATHGRGGIGRLALGSVADKLVRAAEVPVLVVRPEPQRRSVKKRRAGELGVNEPSTGNHEDGKVGVLASR